MRRCRSSTTPTRSRPRAGRRRCYKKTDAPLGQDDLRLRRPGPPEERHHHPLWPIDDAGQVRLRSRRRRQPHVADGQRHPGPASTTGYTYNSFNQLCQRQSGAPATSCPSTSPPYTYDRNGNQLTAPSRTATYNSLDQTTNISGTALIYLGAGQDRWITEGTGSFQHNVLGVGRGTVGTSTDAFTRDEGGKLVSRRNGTTRHYYLFDALGSVTA